MPNSSTEIENPFAPVLPATACPRCFDSGVWLTPGNVVASCPRLVMGERHAEPNEAAKMLRRATVLLVGKKHWIHAMAFDTARILTNFTGENPCSRRQLEEVFLAGTNLSPSCRERKIKGVIEELRKDWLLPIGSRKNEPAGYWIITDLDDFKKWVESAKAAPITLLSTIHKVARRNFPVYAEQLELEFWNDMSAEEPTE